LSLVSFGFGISTQTVKAWRKFTLHFPIYWQLKETACNIWKEQLEGCIRNETFSV